MTHIGRFGEKSVIDISRNPVGDLKNSHYEKKAFCGLYEGGKVTFQKRCSLSVVMLFTNKRTLHVRFILGKSKRWLSLL